MSRTIAKTIRYSLIIVGVLIITLLVAPFFIDVNAYRDKIEQTVEDTTGRHLTIGQINASLFPWVGVELDNVHLANRSGFATQDFLSVKRLHIKLALLPLFSKKIEIKHFEMVAPVVYLERHANGETNWGDLVESGNGNNAAAAADTKSAPAAPALAALQAESLSLRGGKVTWVDANATPVVLSELDVSLKDVQLERPVTLHVSGKLSGNGFKLDVNVGPLGDFAKLNPVSLPVQGHLTADNISLKPFKNMIHGWPTQLGDITKASVKISARIEQRPNGIRLSEGALQLSAAHKLGIDWKIEMPQVDQLKVNSTILTVDGKELIKARGSVEKLTTKPTFKLHIDSQPIARTWLATFIPDLNAMYAGHPSPWKQIKFSASLAGDAKQMNINDLQLSLDNDFLRATGGVVFNGPDIRLRMSAKQLHLDPWLPQGKQNKQNKQTAMRSTESFSIVAAAVAAEAATAEPDLRFLKSWVVTSRLQVGTLFMRGLKMGNFSATINGSKGRFDLNPLSFNLASGKVTEKASINVASYPVKWRESVHITGVQAGPLLKALANMDMLTGSMAMDTSFRATGLSQAAVKSLNGRGNVLFRNGKLKGFDIAGALRKFTNPAAYKEGPKETDFAQLSGSFNVKNGIADNQDLFMASPLLRVTGKGIVNLVNKTMDYHVKPRIVSTLKGQGGSMLRKGLSIPLHISGSFDAPKVRPEINARALLDNVSALLNKGRIGGRLGNILGGGKTASQTSPASSPQKKILKGLSGLIPGF